MIKCKSLLAKGEDGKRNKGKLSTPQHPSIAKDTQRRQVLQPSENKSRFVILREGDFVVTWLGFCLTFVLGLGRKFQCEISF